MNEDLNAPPPHRIKEGDAGTFTPSAGGGSPEPAVVTKRWSDTCVNLRTASEGLPTSVLVVYPDTHAALRPAGYFFTPSVAVDAGPPPTDPV